MQIANRNTDDKAFIIAEIGNNHEGDFGLAKELVHQAADCGVDAVKFQTFKTDGFSSRDDEVRYQRLKGFELSYEQFADLGNLARSKGLAFMSTPLDMESARFLKTEVDAIKIASSDNTFWPLIDEIADYRLPTVISTGLAGWSEIGEAVGRIRQTWRKEGVDPGLGVLHCVSAYPTPAEQANVRVVKELQAVLPDCTVGYSDHTAGIDAALVAVAVGARIIEKHFTIDHNYSEFRDHQLSADPDEMAELIKRVRFYETLLGSGEVGMADCEKEAAPQIRRSIAAARPLEAGHKISQEDIVWVRPGDGLAPGQENLVIGGTLTHAISPGERFDLNRIN